jgi:predicted dehydrogenase
MAEKTFRIIQVGFGGSGRTWYSNVFPEFPEVQVAACVDYNDEIRRRLQTEYELPQDRWFPSLREAISTVDADGVLVATHLETHAPLVREALDAGKHVLVEKPFTRRTDEAAELAAVAGRRGLALVVGQNYRFFPGPKTVAGLMAEGRLGALSAVHIDFRHSIGLTHSADAKHARLEHPLLLDMAIHHFDLLRMLLDTEPKEIACATYNPPWTAYQDPPAALATIAFPNDVLVSYRGSWISHNQRTPWAGEWQMEFQYGTVLWTSRMSATDTSADSVVVRRHDEPAQTVPLVPVPHTDRSGAMAAFLDSVRRGQEAECSGRNNVGTIAFMNGMIESSQTGRPVRLGADA